MGGLCKIVQSDKIFPWFPSSNICLNKKLIKKHVKSAKWKKTHKNYFKLILHMSYDQYLLCPLLVEAFHKDLSSSGFLIYLVKKFKKM